MKFSVLLESVKIFSKYSKNAELTAEYMCFETDVAWEKISEEDRTALEALGWSGGYWDERENWKKE